MVGKYGKVVICCLKFVSCWARVWVKIPFTCLRVSVRGQIWKVVFDDSPRLYCITMYYLHLVDSQNTSWMEGWNAHLDGQLDEGLFSVQVQWTRIQKTFLLIYFYLWIMTLKTNTIDVCISIQYTCADCMHIHPLNSSSLEVLPWSQFYTGNWII